MQKSARLIICCILAVGMLIMFFIFMSDCDGYIRNPTIEQLQGIYHTEPGVYGNDTLGATITLWPDGRCEVVNVPGGMNGDNVVTDHLPTNDEIICGNLAGEAPIRYNFIGHWEIHPQEHRDIRFAYVELYNDGELQQEGFSLLSVFHDCDKQNDSVVVSGLSLFHEDISSYCLSKVSSFK